MSATVSYSYQVKEVLFGNFFYSLPVIGNDTTKLTTTSTTFFKGPSIKKDVLFHLHVKHILLLHCKNIDANVGV